MRIRLLLTAALMSLSAYQLTAQTCGMLLYSNEGRKFKVYANGSLQNKTAMSEVKLCCFPMDIVKVKLEFDDKTVTEKTLYLRMGYIEHHAVKASKIIFDSYEEMPHEYDAVTNVTVINFNGNSTSHSKKQFVTTTTGSASMACSSPISDRSFYEFYGSLKSKNFDTDKLADAKNAVKRDCFTSRQIQITLGAFTSEFSRLEFAKYAYHYVYDKGAYATVKQGFKQSLSGDELDEYINNVK